MEVDNLLDLPWRWLFQTLLMALLAVRFFIASQRCHDKRMGWLLSASAAAGLAIAGLYNFVEEGATNAVLATAAVVFAATLLFAVRGAAHQRPHWSVRRPRRRRRACPRSVRGLGR